jgi:hypothetical protein
MYQLWKCRLLNLDELNADGYFKIHRPYVLPKRPNKQNAAECKNPRLPPLEKSTPSANLKKLYDRSQALRMDE